MRLRRDIWAVVPVKALGQAKSRLSDTLSCDVRAQLARAMLEDVLDGFYSAAHAREIYGVVVDLEAETVDAEATEALRARMNTRG